MFFLKIPILKKLPPGGAKEVLFLFTRVNLKEVLFLPPGGGENITLTLTKISHYLTIAIINKGLKFRKD